MRTERTTTGATLRCIAAGALLALAAPTGWAAGILGSEAIDRPVLGALDFALGTTFGIPGLGGVDFVLNDPSAGGVAVDRTYSATLDTVPAPEPAPIALLGAGFIALAARRRR